MLVFSETNNQPLYLDEGVRRYNCTSYDHCLEKSGPEFEDLSSIW